MEGMSLSPPVLLSLGVPSRPGSHRVYKHQLRPPFHGPHPYPTLEAPTPTPWRKSGSAVSPGTISPQLGGEEVSLLLQNQGELVTSSGSICEHPVSWGTLSSDIETSTQ